MLQVHPLLGMSGSFSSLGCVKTHICHKAKYSFFSGRDCDVSNKQIFTSAGNNEIFDSIIELGCYNPECDKM